MLRVLLAEDHRIVRQGVRLFLESKGVTVIGEAANGREAVEMARMLHPDVIIMDIHMPELTGIEATRRIRHEFDDVRILVLTAYDEPSYIHALLEAGADGFVVKTAALGELYKAVQDITAGHAAFSAETMRRAAQYEHQQTPQESLTERETEVLTLVVRGLTNKEIAKALIISDRTVQGHLQNTYQKLGVSTRTEAVTKALALHLITLNHQDTL